MEDVKKEREAEARHKEEKIGILGEEISLKRKEEERKEKEKEIRIDLYWRRW